MTDDKLKKLRALRALPCGINVESRIAAIKELLGETEVFKTIQNLRWPEGIICPRCHSMNVVARTAPKDSEDKRSYYECLSCQGRGDDGFFDDLTGLPINSTMTHLLSQVQNWILCWYLIGFCSLSQVAKVLGLSLAQVIEMAELGANLTVISHEKKVQLEQGFFAKSPQERIRIEAHKKQEQILNDTLNTQSESKMPFKPGPKSRK